MRQPMTQQELLHLRDVLAERAKAQESQPPSRIASGSGDLFERLQELAASAPVQPPQTRCPALRGDEIECYGSGHVLSDSQSPDSRHRAHRPCRLRWYRDARAELSSELELVGYPADWDALARPISNTLRASFDPTRKVGNLDAMLRMVDSVLSELESRAMAGHIALFGGKGGGKTRALLLLYFAALWRGIPARWVRAADLAQIATDRTGFDAGLRRAAEQELRNMKAAPILVIDDLGDRRTDRTSVEPGTSQVAALLLDILNGFPGRLFIGSNLKPPQLEGHPDVGPRVVSRLSATHKGVPARAVLLDGDDQRSFVPPPYRAAAPRGFLERAAGADR